MINPKTEKQLYMPSSTAGHIFLSLKVRILLMIVVLIVSIIYVGLVSNTPLHAATTYSSKSKDLLWQAKSHWYYDALSYCFNEVIVIESDEKLNFYSDGRGANGFIMRDTLEDIGDDGATGCRSKNNALLRGATAHWGLSNIDLLCSVYERRNGTACKEGNGDFVARFGLERGKYKEAFQKLVKNQVWGGREPTAASGAVQYMYFKETLLKGCAYGKPRLTNNPGGSNVYSVGEINGSSGEAQTVYYVGDQAPNTNRWIWTNPNREWSCGDMAARVGPNGDLFQAYSKWVNGQRVINDDGPINIGTGEEGGGSAEDKPSCVVDGIGWIICPVFTVLSSVADASFGFLANSFLEIDTNILNTNPTAKDGKNAIGTETYQAWRAMQGIANIAFVIAFIFIIYSQLTGMGINNYGVKRLLPRIIIAAILVNTSFIICQIAVDLSNILGYSLKNIFGAIDIAGVDKGTNVLGGTEKIGFGALSVAILAGAGVSIWLGLPVLGGAILATVVALLTVMLILIARKALIILLVAIAPLAFVAYLLPNTEQFFTRWRKIFTALLLVFPIVGVLFGAGTLASKILMNVAGTDPILQIVALMAGAIPLFAVIPLLKHSLDSVNSIGGKINAIGSKAEGKAQARGDKAWANSRLGKARQFRAEKRDFKDKLTRAGAYRGRNPVRTVQSAANRLINKYDGAFGRSIAADGLAMSTELDEKEMKNSVNLLSSHGLTADQMNAIVLGKDSDGNPVNIPGIDTNSETIRRAAIQIAMSQNSLSANEEIIANSGLLGSAALSKEVARSVTSNNLASKANYLGGDFVDKISKGEVKSQADLDMAAASRINGGKYSAQSISTQDPKALERISKIANATENGTYTTTAPDGTTNTVNIDTQQLKALQDQAFNVLNNDSLNASTTAEQKRHIENIDVSRHRTNGPSSN